MSRGVSYSEVAILERSGPLVLTLRINEVFFTEPTGFRIRHATNAEEALDILEHEDVSVLVLGPGLKLATSQAILHRMTHGTRYPLTIVTGFEHEPDLLQEFVDSGLIFYVSRGPLTQGQLHAVVNAAIHRCARTREDQQFFDSAGQRMERAVEYGTRLLNQTEMASISGLLVEAVSAVIGVDRAACLLYDAEKETLSSVVHREERTESAASGIVAFAARTSLLIELERVGTDPRFDPQADNPDGSPDDRLIAAPLIGLKGVPVAVIVAVREADAPVFSSEDITIIEFLAECGSLPLSTLLLSKRLEPLVVRQRQTVDIFRREALDHHTGLQEVEGELILTPPEWLRRAHWLTVALLAASLILLVVARVKEKAAGIAIIRARSKITLAAPTGGLIRSVEVATGETIRRGDLLVRFQDLRATTGADQLHEQLRAPDDGVIGDVLVRAGQQVVSGDPVATIVHQNAGYELIILLPGQYAPQVRRGMLGSFTVDGYPDSREVIEIEDVGSEIVGPREAARYAGITDAVTVSNPIVVVRCHLKSAQFSSGNKSYVYRDGMTARAEVDLRSEPMIVDLLPGLKEFIRNLK